MSETTTKHCEKHGEFVSKSIAIFGGKKLFSKCPECQKEIDKENAEKAVREEQKRMELEAKQKRDRLIANGLMPRYIGLDLEKFNPTDDQKRAYDACLLFSLNYQEMAAKGQTLIFCGTVGTGKTMLAHALLQTLDFGNYLRAVDISRLVRDCYTRNESEYELIERLANSKLLVIDEVGVQQDTKHESLLITDLIDRRYGNLLPTVICSNLNKDKLKDQFGERAWDRLTQNSLIIPILGKSQR